MKNKSKKKIWIIVGVVLVIIIIGSVNNKTLQDNNNKVQNNNKEDSTEPVINQDEDNPNQNKEEKIPTCDGTTITSDCEVDGIIYSIYKYYPAEEEKYHFETITTYERQITGYCTLCNDGTYSPTCATGRGACSHHGGVREWNAPVYSEVPKTEEKKIIDSPAMPERWEKVVKED